MLQKFTVSDPSDPSGKSRVPVPDQSGFLTKLPLPAGVQTVPDSVSERSILYTVARFVVAANVGYCVMLTRVGACRNLSALAGGSLEADQELALRQAESPAVTTTRQQVRRP